MSMSVVQLSQHWIVAAAGTRGLYRTAETVRFDPSGTKTD